MENNDIIKGCVSLNIFKSVTESLAYDCCPICRQNMSFFNTHYISMIADECNNGCYSFDFAYEKMDLSVEHQVFTIFGERIIIKSNDSDDKILQLKKYIENRIQHWKENDRYLAEILVK